MLPAGNRATHTPTTFDIYGNNFSRARNSLRWTPNIEVVAAVMQVENLSVDVFGEANQNQAQVGLFTNRASTYDLARSSGKDV